MFIKSLTISSKSLILIRAVVAYVFNPSTWESEADRFLRVGGKLVLQELGQGLVRLLHGEILSINPNKKESLILKFDMYVCACVFDRERHEYFYFLNGPIVLAYVSHVARDL